MGEDEEGTIRTLNHERLHLLNGALDCLASVSASIGDLDKVKRIVKVLGLVNSTEDFKDQPKVMNGASELLVQIFGDKGKHARSMVGVAFSSQCGSGRN